MATVSPHDVRTSGGVRLLAPRLGQVRWRRLWLLLTTGLMVVGVSAAALVGWRWRAGPALTGWAFSHPQAAPDFTLVDQRGQTISLDQFRGKVVAVAFLYTHCPDECPLIASTMARAERQLGSDTRRLELVAVSVDPVGDTLPAVKQFSQDHGLAGFANWHYLMGSPAQLQPVWQAYQVGTTTSQQNPGLVAHEGLVWLVDPAGKERAWLPSDFSVGDFVHDVRALL